MTDIEKLSSEHCILSGFYLCFVIDTMLLTLKGDGPVGIDDDDDGDNDDFGGGMDDDLFSKFGWHTSTLVVV